MRKTHLWKEEVVEANGLLTISATIENPDRERTNLWYRVPAKYSSAITESCDPFVVAIIFAIMNQSTDLVVHGEVSPSLLRNLEEFQAAWFSWQPNQYRQVKISAEIEREQSRTEVVERAISGFSGGLDSCFTAYRHRQQSSDRFQYNLQAGLMVHGFDIPLYQEEVFERAAEKSRVMLDSLGLELIPIATNLKGLFKVDWEDSCSTAIASCFMLLQKSYTTGLIASSYSYRNLIFPLGSNPLTDRLIRSKSFEIIHDGALYSRSEKAKGIIDWPEALENLRVCWRGKHKDRNCGRCEKCIRTILNFRVLGSGLPLGFEKDVTDEQILELKVNRLQLHDLEEILNIAKTENISDSWVQALEKCVKRHNRKPFLNGVLPDPWRNRLRQLKPLLYPRKVAAS